MNLTDWLQVFGITPQQLTPTAIVCTTLFLAQWKLVLKDMKSDIADLKYEVTDLHHATREIQKYIEDNDETWNPQHRLGTNPIFFCYGQTNSPIRPNTKGEKLLTNAGFYEQYPLFKNELFKAMDAMKLRTLYDYEKGAKRALRQLQDDPHFDPIKNYVVNHPNEPLALIFTVASWIIRDDYERYQNEKLITARSSS